jgi:hypothetical protein
MGSKSSEALGHHNSSPENPLIELAAMFNSMYLLMLEPRTVAR